MNIPAAREASPEYRKEYKNMVSFPGSPAQKAFFSICAFFAVSLLFLSAAPISAQEGDLEYVLDLNSNVIPLPNIFKPAADLSGRGMHNDPTWPQSLADHNVIDAWQKQIGFNGIYRLQYNLWDISEVSGNRWIQAKLLANYEDIIKRVSDSGGTVILNVFGTPQGQGKVLDKKSSPVDLKAFKSVVKDFIKYYSCVKRYNIWYEVWTAPDLDGFFLGRQQEYLNLYKAVAESVAELEAEFKVSIPVGGPSSSWWFRSVEGNTNITPERSLIYELIKFCYHYKLPLDFISWHAYSTDPKTEKEMTSYNKTAVALLRDWLNYFNMERVLLVVDEWNYDNGLNLSAERRDRVFVAASYIPSRVRHMYEAGIDHQVFFSLEDFQYNKEGVERNVGVFWFTPDPAGYNGGAKSIFNVFQAMSMLGQSMFVHAPKLGDEFTGVIATKSQDKIILLIYNYIDTDIFRNYLSRNIALLKESERRQLLSIMKSEKMDKILRRQIDVAGLRLTNRTKTMLKKAQDLSDSAARFSAAGRNLKIFLKNLKEEYVYSRYTVDSSCNSNCGSNPSEMNIPVPLTGPAVSISLNPYSVNLLVLTKKPKELEKNPVVENASVKENIPQAKEPAEQSRAPEHPVQPEREIPKPEKNPPAKTDADRSAKPAEAAVNQNQPAAQSEAK